MSMFCRRWVVGRSSLWQPQVRRGMVTKRQKNMLETDPKKALAQHWTTPLMDHELVQWRNDIEQKKILPSDEEYTLTGISKADPEDMLDFASMYNPSIHLPDKPDFSDPRLNYEIATDLSTHLEKYIGVRGPITTAEYMRQALTHPLYGYYTQPSNHHYHVTVEESFFDNDWDLKEDNNDNNNNNMEGEIFGPRGDFVTAPEISQIFGECLCIWLVLEWQRLGCPPQIQLVEIGPGRGTLMSDVLKTAYEISNGAFAQALLQGGGIHMVEVSPILQLKQQTTLSDNHHNFTDPLTFITEKYKEEIQEEFGEEDLTWHQKAKQVQLKRQQQQQQPSNEKETTKRMENTSLTVEWHTRLSNVPKGIPTFFLCQEFIDALPVHSFQKTEDGWRERLVDVDTKPDTNNPEVLVTAKENKNLSKGKKPRLRFVIPPDTTPAARSLLNIDKDGNASKVDDDDAQVGDILEICPEGMMLVQDIASRIEESQGAAIIVDYGSPVGSGDTLRAFSKHEQVHVLSHPGQVDVTADVDFHALKQCILGRNCQSHGSIPQGQFLASMGAVDRVLQLIEKEETTDEQAQELYNALERLVSPQHMGERYQVLALTTPRNDDESDTIHGFS